MGRFEFGYVPTLQANPVPGTYIPDANSFNNGMFPGITVGAENTALDFEYFAYDRLKFATRAGVAFPDRYGAVVWQRNQIFELGVGPAWVSAHTVVSMSGDLDFGVHTGLYKFYGRDGRAYLGGFYRGSVANETGCVIWDYETGTWTSWTTDLGHASFTACTYPIPYKGRLLLATQGRIYSMDPVSRRLDSYATGKTLDPTDKLFVLGTRLFLVGRSGGAMGLYECLGGGSTTAPLGTLSSFGRASGGDFAVVNDYERVAIFWKGPLIPGVGPPPDFTFDTYHRWYSVSITSDQILSGVSTMDHTFESQGSLTVGVIPLDSTRATGFHEAEPGFFSNPQRTFARLHWRSGSAATSGVHPQNREEGGGALSAGVRNVDPVNSGTIGFQGGTGTSQLSHISSRYGGSDGIWNLAERAEDYKIEDHPSLPGVKRIRFSAHSLTNRPQSVRLYFRPRASLTVGDALGTPFPTTAGSIVGTSVGSLNANGKQADNVTFSTNGEDHYIDWDRGADLGSGASSQVPWRLVTADAGELPAL